MKRISAFILVLVMCLGLAACSGGSALKNGNSVSQSESTSDRQMPGEDEYYDRLGDAKETAYEVISTDAEVISYFGKWGQIHVFTLIKNVSDSPFIINVFNKYDLYRKVDDGDDVLIEEMRYYQYNVPQVLQPGEIGYLYSYAADPDTTPDDTVYAVPHIGGIRKDGEGNTMVFHEATAEGVYNIPDDTTRIELRGTLTASDEMSKNGEIFVYAVGFDASGKPICMFVGSVEDAAPGNTYEFTLTAEVYNHFTAEDVASTQISTVSFGRK